MAFHLRIGRPFSHLGLHALSPLVSFHAQRDADPADHAEDHTTHARHHSDLHPKQADPIVRSLS